MLSPSSAAVVRETLPVVGAAIGEITPIFYRRLFAAYPELERDLFNRGNQAQGDQQRALAASIAVYATLLVAEDGPPPREVLSRIAHKHASLGVTEDQYPIVHKYLFEAIVEVLGEAVTPEVAAAWDEVYWQMAKTLIGFESNLYTEAGVTPGDVFRDLVVRRRTQETPDTVSFVLASPDGQALYPGRPGQYVSVGVRLTDGARQLRQYSLLGSEEDTWRISVRAVSNTLDEGEVIAPAGTVSNHLHANVFEGDHLEVTIPFGELTLTDAETPLVLASAGIGVTPMVGFLHHLADTGSTRPVTVLHADRTPARHAHRAEIKDLVGSLPHAELTRWYEDLGPRPERDDLNEGLVRLDNIDLPANADVYLCGPAPFMTAMKTALLERGVPKQQIRCEIFGPDQEPTTNLRQPN